MKREVLFVLRTRAALLENFPVAERLRAKERYDVAFLVDPAQSREHVPLICEKGYRALHPSGRDLRPTASAKCETPGVPRWSLRDFLFHLAPRFLQNFFLYRSQLRRIRICLRPSDPDSVRAGKRDIAVIVLSGDRALGWEIAVIKAANERHIPTLITPYAITFLESIAECRVRREDYVQRFAVKGFLRQIVARAFPRWVFNYEGRRMFYYPIEEALPAALLGLMPKNPWTLGGGAATRMAVESEYAKSVLLRDGVEPLKMVVTGKPCNDGIVEELHSGSRNTLRRELSVPDESVVLLCSLPQLGEHELLSWEEHWKDIEWMLGIFASFKSRGVTTVVSLHPKCDWDAYKRRCGPYGIIVAPQRIYRLMVAADVFTAAVSSTVTQAIAAHVPAVVEDHRSLDHRGYYEGAPGVIMVRQSEAYAPALERVLFDENERERLRREQEHKASHWALMDGKCTQRIVQEIYGLAQE